MPVSVQAAGQGRAGATLQLELVADRVSGPRAICTAETAGRPVWSRWKPSLKALLAAGSCPAQAL